MAGGAGSVGDAEVVGQDGSLVGVVLAVADGVAVGGGVTLAVALGLGSVGSTGPEIR